MARSLAFLHTSPVHIQTFNALLAELAPGLPVRHMVDESLLRDACEAGTITPALRQRVEKALLAATSEDDDVVLCTCSSLGAVAEQFNTQVAPTFLRIDRPMAEQAVHLGSRIVVAATLSTTLDPTCELLKAVARQVGKAVEIRPLLCDQAWSYFEQGDQEGYLHEVARCLQEGALWGDVLVLAQASMARAVERCSELSLPILTSPRSGLLAALEVYGVRSPSKSEEEE